MEEYRNQAIDVIKTLTHIDYDETPALKKYYSTDRPKDIREVWNKISEDCNLSEKESREIFETPLKYSLISSNQTLIKWNKKEIYTTESMRLSDIIKCLIHNSQSNHQYFGRGTNMLNSLLVENFKTIYPYQLTYSNGSIKKLFNSEIEYHTHIINLLKREYVLFIYKNTDNSFLRLIIPLFRTEKEGEYVGGLLHLLQHLQINKKPISAKDKTQKGSTEFYSDILFKNVFDAFFHVIEKKQISDFKKPENFEFNSEGVNLRGGFYYNLDAKCWFINSIMQI